MAPIDVRELQPGDCLLYRPRKRSVFGWLIAIKTWNEISHCELYVGSGHSVAARDGIGVDLYPWRDTELAYVLRPDANDLCWAKFWIWFDTVRYQKYDWFGLLRFAWVKSVGGGNNGRMFCSEFETRAYRALEYEPFTSAVDADAVVPADFLKSARLTIIRTPLSLR